MQCHAQHTHSTARMPENHAAPLLRALRVVSSHTPPTACAGPPSVIDSDCVWKSITQHAIHAWKGISMP